MGRRAGLLVAGLLAFLASVAGAEEKILAFDSDILIDSDGSVLVTESITVRVEGNRIRRGIYRDFPLRYRDRFGNEVAVDYEPVAVLRNGDPEPYFSERLSNGLRTYFGSPDRLLATGEHRYEFRYRVDRVLGYFETHDEFYWNVTGLDWAFAIERASARIRLTFAGDPEIESAEGFTGYAGATGDDFLLELAGDTARFETTRELRPHEGLTIVVTWPKGFVEPPGRLTRIGWLLEDNRNLLVLVLGFILVLAYLIPVWTKFGKDPDEGLIVSRYEPPEGLSPASLRFIRDMRYDNKVMTAAVLNLAVAGCLRIDRDGDDYTLVRQRPASNVTLPATEQALYDALFEKGDRLVLDDKYHSRIGGARSKHRAALRAEYRGRYFRTNGLLHIPALVIALISIGIALKIGPRPTPLLIVAGGLMVLTVSFFSIIMKRPTALGRRTLDATLGFRDYLDIAEKDELNLRNPPEKTPELFERFLPYALALDVEQNWSERFAEVLASARDAGTADYQPAWYSGSWNSFDMARTTASMSRGLSSAISSSASPPGSSSGSGGGGSSGGGGGGGGGGGW